MPRCPQCNKNLVDITPRCPSCQADLSLLVDYVGNLQGGLDRADNFTRSGELGQAVWAYLEVLEVDPDNPAARRQVSQVATAVRQFDMTVPGRRWAQGLGPLTEDAMTAWIRKALILIALVAVFCLGIFIGANSIDIDDADPKSTPQGPPRDKQMGPPSR